jgi:predicted metallopeptidase
MISYEHAEDIRSRVHDIVARLSLSHVDVNRVACLRSRGGSSRYTLARCHVLPRVFQKALGVRAHYIIEVVSEKFDRLSPEEQTKVLIHEILHIPKSFGGGFKHHDYVNRSTVERFYERYKSGR